jgi:hypothetical protein
MTLPSSGPIAMSDINNELGSVRNHMDDVLVRALAGRPTGSTAIFFSDLWGKTGKIARGISLDSNASSVGFSGTLLMNAQADHLFRNASNGNCELDFISAPAWQGNYTITNNSTGVSAVLVRQNSVSWQGANPANLLRPNTGDFFTIIPS